MALAVRSEANGKISGGMSPTLTFRDANADNLLDSIDFDHQAFRDPPRLPEPGRTSHPSTCTPGEPGPIPPPN